MHKLLEVPRRNFARARLTISLARSSPTKGVILVCTWLNHPMENASINDKEVSFCCYRSFVSRDVSDIFSFNNSNSKLQSGMSPVKNISLLQCILLPE